MKDILTWGKVEKDFNRLNIDPKRTWMGISRWEKEGDRPVEMAVYSLTDEEFKILEKEQETLTGWMDTAWRYAEGANVACSEEIFMVNGQEMWGGIGDSFADEDYPDSEEKPAPREYDFLLQYICDEIGASQPRNVAAVAVELARSNRLSLGALFCKYQTAQSYKPTIIMDFDGVIHSYVSGWQGVDRIDDGPVPGIKEALKDIRGFYQVAILSTRCESPKGMKAIQVWLDRYEIVVDKIVDKKIPALVIVDDRALQFTGDTGQLLQQIQNFKTWQGK